MKIHFVICLEFIRLGLIVPSSNTTMEHEFCRMVPSNATVHSERMKMSQYATTRNVKDLETMEVDSIRAAAYLADAMVQVIGYGCTSGSLARGHNHDNVIVSRIREATEIPAVTTSGAMVEALDFLKVKKLSVATPYCEEVNNMTVKFLESHGFHVLKVESGDFLNESPDNIKIGKQPPAVAYGLAKKAYMPEADGIFIGCTNFRTIEIIEKLESELKKPVVSSNTATLWSMLRKVSFKNNVKGYGCLLERTCVQKR